MIGMTVNWGACLFGLAFDDDNHTINFYVGPFCFVIGSSPPDAPTGKA